MPVSKRRKLEKGREAPQSAVSALSALRQRAAAPVLGEAIPTPEDEAKRRVGNQFSALQHIAQVNQSPSTPKSPASRRDGTPKRSTEKGVTTSDSGASTQLAVPYSSFRLGKHNYRKHENGHSELRLSDSERFVVLGSFGIKVRSGQVAILGTTLSVSEDIHWIHAPQCHALPVIRTSEKTRLELHSDRADCQLLCLSSLSPLYQGIWHDSGKNPNIKGSSEDTFKILCTSDDAPKKSVLQELNSPPEWNKAISDIASSKKAGQQTQVTTLVCGPKGAGKSTFSKLLTNRLLTTMDGAATEKSFSGIAVIDLDPGQPEYSPPGTVSLIHVTKANFGPPFSHPGLHQLGYRVLRTHALASVSPATSPSLYIQCATDLYETYRRTLRNCPLLINTPGWILGTGLNLLVKLIQTMTPSQTVYMSEEGPVDVVESLRSATRYDFLTLPSQPSASTARTGSQLRAMQTLSYFHSTEIPGTASPPIPSWDARPISAVPPWEVHYASEKKGIKGILSYDYQSPPELFRAAIDGMVLAVVEVEDEKAFREITAGYDTTLQQPAASVQNSANETETQGICPEQGKCTDKLKIIESPEGLPMISNTNDATLDPNYSRVMGLALVRGVDTINKKLQLISPLTESQIQSARSQGHDIILLHGKFDAPTWAYAEDFFHQRATASLEEQAEQRDVDVTYEGAGEESHGAVQEDYVEDVPQDAPAVPWLEILQGHQKRPVGSGVWRVRRDLGRSTGD